MAYKRIGGLHFWRIGRLGGSIYLRRNAANGRPIAVDLAIAAIIYVVFTAVCVAVS